MNDITAFFAFLKYYLGYKVDMSRMVAGMDWQELYSFASKQAILGLCFEGIERLGEEYPEELRLPPIGRELLMTWMGKAQQIRRQNMKVNAGASKLYSMLREDGLRCCILKGQGNALMYPNPYSRTPGDIDVWVNANREDITEYAKRHFTLEDDIRFHHLETTMDGVPVELHFFPCSMNNPIYHARLQKWFRRNADLQCSNVVSLPDGIGEIAIPTTAFNVVYQLCHLYHHFFDEGIGMRQIIDYYYVVDDFWKVKESFSQPSRPSLPKEGSTAFPKPLSPQGTEDVTALRCSEPLRSKDGGASKPSPYFAGWDRLGVHYDENNVLKKIDTTLEYHVAHSNPHMLFEKMVELGFASSNSDAFEKCWNSLMKTETGTNYLYELNDFLYHCCQHFAPQIKKNGNSKSIKYRYTEHDSSGTLGEPEGGCSCDSPNLDHLIKLQKGREFYDVYQKSEWVVCDSKILYLFGKFFEGGGLEGAICYRPEAGFAWCAVSWYPAVAKGVGTRAEATDAMDGDGGNDTKTAIEVHFTPSYMFFPIHNSRMQKWLYRHVFTEGIGLRQLIDYYFVLVKSEERRVKNLTALQRELKYLGLWKFAGAVMYVLHEALGVPEAKMIAPIDVNEGRFLLAEIMQGGNFGQFDTRLGSKENEGKLHRYLRMSLRNLRFVKHYPTEALSEPLFRTWFALWKKIHGIK